MDTGLAAINFVATPVTDPAAPTSRLNKRMAELGLCSRREADDWIAKGWVKVCLLYTSDAADDYSV